MTDRPQQRVPVILSPSRPRRRGLHVRLLPALIFVSVLMVGVRVGDLWEGITGTGPQTASSPLTAEARERVGKR